MDTIFAQATAPGRAGVAIVRVSGPLAFAAAKALSGEIPSPRMAGLRRLRVDGALVDEALVLAFEHGGSFTGEDVVEFHLHGSVAIVAAVLRGLGAIPGLRLAEPGEFTRRALENGRLDLAQVEGLSDLIDAETEAQRKQAMATFSGGVSRQVEAWRLGLIHAAALIEATIDFADEDVPTDVAPDVLRALDGVIADLRRECAGVDYAERVRDGFEVAIIGPPNAGKSTLLNALAGREAAITSEVAGTTRDVIEVRMNLSGIAVTLLDTAGLRTAGDRIEAMGVDLAIRRAQAADLRVFLLDGNDLPQQIVAQPGDIVVQGKADLGNRSEFSVSGKTGQGVEELLSRITATLGGRAAQAGLMSRERHREALTRALLALEAARSETQGGLAQPEVTAENIRAGLRALESLVGRVDVEHLLDSIFANFCIGK